jgi:stage II sporulation SpoAA-like protein
MIEINLAQNGCFVAARFRGAVTNTEFADLAAAIADLGSTGTALIYLDWVRVDHWTFAPVPANGVTAWRMAARMIERVAIIHDHHWNRQAAWLAAILRREGVTVRSWPPQNAHVARLWLGSARRQLH